MKGKYYTSERSIQILIALLKAHNIRKIIASPGTTNLSFVASLMQDKWFEMFSSVDERSAAYMACGLAAESGEAVVLTCTGATASRNYIPGLTEAYYRKLPVLAITSTQDLSKIGHLVPQVIDRRQIQHDIALLSEYIPVTTDDTTEWSNTIKINRALLELFHRGGGPVHLNITTTYSRDYSIKELPASCIIHRICLNDKFPILPQGRIAIFIGSHRSFSNEETNSIDKFCSVNNAVVFCDHTSGYYGKYRVQFSLVKQQENYLSKFDAMDLLIHIGEITGDYAQTGLHGKEVWRVNEDGELRDLFHKLTYVFEMKEVDFFKHYSTGIEQESIYLKDCKAELESFQKKLSEVDLPFSNVWAASQCANKLPENSKVHLGILNTLRCWNLFEFPVSVQGFCNVGGFGIDGIMSTLIGASLSDLSKVHYAILGDLAFFYDLNSLGNRHVSSNVRIMLINNGKGTEFRNYTHPGSAFGDDADYFIAAGGHYGNKSSKLVKHYAEDLGFQYMTASNKDEFLNHISEFVNPKITKSPILFEVFTTNEDESDAIKIASNIMSSSMGIAKNIANSVLSNKGKEKVKKLFGR